MLVLFGVGVAYAVALVLLVLGVVLVAGLRGGGRSERSDEPVSWSTLLSGVTFVRSRPIVLGSISLDLFAVLFGGATALLPLYAGEILDVGPVGLGVMRAAPAVGAALVGAVVAVWPIRRRVGSWMFGGVAAFGVATIVFGLSTSLALSLVALAVMGAGDMVSVYIRHLLVQLETPDEIRGRVSAVNSVFIGASNELGEFESGVTASWWGTVPSVVIGGSGDAGRDRRLDVALPGPAPPRPVPPRGRGRPRGIGARIGRVIDPVAFTIGPVQVHWYGILIAAAALVGTLLATRVARWLGEDPEEAWSMLLIVMIFAVLGARLYHVIHLWGHYSANPIEIPQVWNGGLGIPGGIAGGALGILVYTRSRGLSTARWMDIAAPALLLGQAIGRLGQLREPGAVRAADHVVRRGISAVPAVRDPDRRGAPRRNPVGLGDLPGRDDAVRAALRLRSDPQRHRCRGPALRHSPLRPAPVRR